jgi:hypothetical protein
MDPLSEVTIAAQLKDYVSGGFIVNRLAFIRQRAGTGRPLGNAEFVESLEKAMERRLTLNKCGPHQKIVTDRRQGELTFDL